MGNPQISIPCAPSAQGIWRPAVVACCYSVSNPFEQELKGYVETAEAERVGIRPRPMILR